MLRYICMLFDANGVILRVEPFDATTDRCAGDQGILFQLVTRNAVAFEVWRGASKVAAHYGKRPAWTSRRVVADASAPEPKRAARTPRKRQLVAGLSP